jgi:hypothetical protein
VLDTPHQRLDLLGLGGNPLGDEGLAALARGAAAAAGGGALPPPTGVRAKLTILLLSVTQITNTGCASLVALPHRCF